MRPTEMREFKAVMRDAREAVGQGEPYTEGALELMFASLAEFPLAAIQQALIDHINSKDGKWRPNPAYIRDQIGKRAPVLWVTGDEAWGTAPKLETDSGVCNQVVAAALAVAQDLIDRGDMVAARRTFVDAYNARVEQAKNHPDPAQRVPITFISGGNLPQRYEDTQGQRQMLLERAQKNGLLPAPRVDRAPQLEIAKCTPGAKPDLKALLLTMKPKTMPPPEPEDYER
ncbi:MAG: hypothetical protein V4631_22205 [Pseudomonadota bacterium]